MKKKIKKSTVDEMLHPENETSPEEQTDETHPTDAKDTQDRPPEDSANDQEKTDFAENKAEHSPSDPHNEEQEEEQQEKDDTPEPREEPGESETPKEELTLRYLRLQADFQNYKRRTQEEQKNTVRYANERLILQLLDVVDNFERALATEKEHDNFFLGMDMIHAQLREILEKNGVEAIKADGAAFDPNLHHAVLTEESAEVEEGHVIETLQTGYLLNGKLIRPAMVKVAK